MEFHPVFKISIYFSHRKGGGRKVISPSFPTHRSLSASGRTMHNRLEQRDVTTRHILAWSTLYWRTIHVDEHYVDFSPAYHFPSIWEKGGWVTRLVSHELNSQGSLAKCRTPASKQTSIACQYRQRAHPSSNPARISDWRGVGLRVSIKKWAAGNLFSINRWCKCDGGLEKMLHRNNINWWKA